MTKAKKSVSFVCMANYCRSPVAKMLLKHKFGDSIETDSAGIRPLVSAGMDPRSLDFLTKNDVYPELHTPKKVDKNFFASSDIIFAMDTFILMQLNKTFKKYRNKFKLFSYQYRNLNIVDPYKLSDEDYKNVMEDIKLIVTNLVLD